MGHVLMVLAEGVSLALCIAGWFGVSLREHLRKPRADDTGHLGHKIGHLSPFLRQQILFQLGMNRPLRIDLHPLSGHEYPKQFHIPAAGFGYCCLGLVRF